MALFDKRDWVSQGKIWRDIPPHVKRVCDQDFVIPAAMASKILPQDGLSVTSFLDFTVPLPATTIENPDVSRFFSKIVPDRMDDSAILRLRRLQMPPVAVIRRLVVAGKQAWLDGFTSVKYAHINGDTLTHFPLWVITFWNTVVDMRLQIRKPWREAMDWVKQQMQQKKRSDARKMAAETSCLLALLHWNTAKRGLSDTSPVIRFGVTLAPPG
jgi:hypothetical protein